MIYTVTGRVWCAATNLHTKLQSIEFERRADALLFMAGVHMTDGPIQGMVIDRDAEAIAFDKACALDARNERELGP